MPVKEQNSEMNTRKSFEEAELSVCLLDNDVIAASNIPCPDDSCFAPGTEITMEDGSVKNIEDIQQGDMVLTFDHEAGALVGRAVIFAFASDDEKYKFTLHFTHGIELTLVNKHFLFERESRKYVCITRSNAEQYIGNHFYSAKLGEFVELLHITSDDIKTRYYTLDTAKSINYIANGMLNVSDDVSFLLNLYQFDESLKADAEVLAADIQKYGIFAYSPECGLPEEEYDAWNMRYLNIAVGKGLITWDTLLKQHSNYIGMTD